ncbi:SAM-dependent methyltransferase [Histidinibacterium aquaticum]|uniref:Class I SAM-dependent methyltransferase n=1 Tax=Histidinibacterium aquaticum TaxID=2613962 RepID=A0A5J5GKN0_9RHOB|nr:cyclopropane-fatty-acyl-phospholipid synthase family protein [Histidinibacterium aquaticum]KAA9008213.1 class I SAM-dependent methyltransferase [Histidinibacterium aquaticum]
MWTRALDQALKQLFQVGALELTFADGTTRRYGEPGVEPVRVSTNDPTLPRKLLLAPDLALGEAYMDGRITIAQDDLRGLLEVAVRNRNVGNDPAIMRMGDRLARPVQRYLSQNPVLRSRQNIAHHYDLSGELYDLFLDEDRQYSCAYFADPEMTLDEAQRAKKHHIAKKLCIRPGDKVLDIGCGWGGMALTLAQDYDAEVVGITLSDEQYRIAKDRAQKAGLEDRVTFLKEDYRNVRDSFDRIVSVGMFEHVGAAHYREYFDTVSDLLKPEGVALIHTIGSAAPPRATSSWVRKYIFPGGYLPSMSEVLATVEKVGLHVADVEVWRMHYARTLRHWHDRFMSQIDRARELYDERFTRMWRYYLTAAETSFAHEKLAVFQFQLSHDKTAVPLTRDYLYTD